MTKLVVIAVLFLAALATADAFRASPRERVVASAEVLREPLVVHRSDSELVPAGVFIHKRVLEHGREYLSAEAVDAAFPADLGGVPFDIAYVARAADGLVALGIYKFPYGTPVRAGVELWRGHTLAGAFEVPPGAFAGGLGFAAEGRLIATLSSDGMLVHLFTRGGRSAGRQPATSW
jgi:hypothetical protein